MYHNEKKWKEREVKRDGKKGREREKKVGRKREKGPKRIARGNRKERSV